MLSNKIVKRLIIGILITIITPVIWGFIFVWYITYHSDRVNQSMGKEDFENNYQKYTQMVECVKKDPKKYYECNQKEIPNTLVDVSDFRTGACWGLFSGSMITVSNWTWIKKNNVYYYFLENKTQNASILQSHSNELDKLGITILTNDWIMCTYDRSIIWPRGS